MRPASTPLHTQIQTSTLRTNVATPERLLNIKSLSLQMLKTPKGAGCGIFSKHNWDWTCRIIIVSSRVIYTDCWQSLRALQKHKITIRWEWRCHQALWEVFRHNSRADKLDRMAAKQALRGPAFPYVWTFIVKTESIEDNTHKESWGTYLTLAKNMTRNWNPNWAPPAEWTPIQHKG